jgi:hypothetical protein
MRAVPDLEPDPQADAEPAPAGPATERYDVLANDTGEVAAVFAATPAPGPDLRGADEDDDDDLFLELERAAGTSAHGEALLASSDDPDGGDDAIRAFFDSDDDPGRRWFGRRR